MKKKIFDCLIEIRSPTKHWKHWKKNAKPDEENTRKDQRRSYTKIFETLKIESKF